MIDCHLHLQDPRFVDLIPALLAGLRSLGITRLVVNGTGRDDWDAVESIASEHAEVIPSFGLHPWKVGREGNGWLGELEERLRRIPSAGIGEIGLDRWIRGSDFARQVEVFRSQLDLAHRLARPVTVHCLKAWGHLLGALKEAGLPQGFLLHSYVGPPEMVETFVSLGAYFSLSGYFFRPGKEAKLAAFDRVPDSRILLETDAPDMSPPAELIRFPWPRAGEGPTNHPGNLVAIYEAFAARKGLAPGEAEHLIGRNFAAWYSGNPGMV